MIKRTRLLDDIADPTRRRWLIEAGAGMGKTVLLEHMRAELVESLIIVRRPLSGNGLRAFLAELSGAARRLGHTRTATALAVTDADPALAAGVLAENNQALAIDDLHYWSDEVGEFIYELIRVVDPDADILLAGRFLPGPLEPLRRSTHWHDLGASDLAFTQLETAQALAALGIDEVPLIDELHLITSGWPLAVTTAALRLRDAAATLPDRTQPGREQALLGDLLESHKETLDTPDLQSLHSLALMPFFDDVIADLFGSSGLLARLSAAGVAITRRLDGWAELADPLRSSIRRQHERSPGSLRRAELPPAAIHRLVAKGEVHAAISACLAFDNPTLAAATIAGLSRHDERDLDIASLELAIAALGDVAASAPRALMVLARRHFESGAGEEALELFRTGVALFDDLDPGLDDPDHVEMLLQFGTFLTVAGNRDQAEPIVARVASRVEAIDRPLLNADLHELRGLIAHGAATDRDLAVATAEFTTALAIRRTIGEPAAIASTLARLAVGILWPQSRPAEALTMLDDVHSLDPMPMWRQARMSVARAFILPYVGRAHEVPEVVANARRSALLLGLRSVALQGLVAEIVAASVMGQNDRTRALAQEFAASDELIYNEGQHAVHTVMVAEAAARCKYFDLARRLLDRARDVPGAGAHDVAWADASIGARDGDAETALRTFNHLSQDSDLSPNHRWRYMLFRSYAHVRLGHIAEAEQLLRDAFAYCRNNGEPAMPTIVENVLVHEIQEELRDSTAPPASPTPAIIEIALFDDFRFAVNGQTIVVPPGQPRELIALLILNSGRLVIDQVIDALWPDADMAVGRKRLRNVLNRLRSACGDLVERSDESLVLTAAVESDYTRAVVASRQALAPPLARPRLKRAIALLDRELLPATADKAWIDEARALQRYELARLLDAHAVQAETAGDTDAAVAALRRAAQLEPDDVSRIAHAAQLLEADGRTATARSIRDPKAS